MNDAQIIQIIQAAILAGTPLVFASVGELLTERSGVLNLGVNGMMLVGAISGFWATFATSSLTLGVLAGLVAGLISPRRWRVPVALVVSANVAANLKNEPVDAFVQQWMARQKEAKATD